MKDIKHIYATGVNVHMTDEWARLKDSGIAADLENQIRDHAERFSESVVLLSTCNRIEIYGEGEMAPAIAAIEAYTGPAHLTPMIKQGEEAVRHLHHVASGLQSQLLGEMEILGQFKKSFKAAKENQRLSGYMERLANHCIQAAKEVRFTTKLTTGTSSLSYAAIQLLMRKYKGRPGKVLVVGTGRFGTSIAKNLRDYLPQLQLSLTNRSADKAHALASEIGADTLAFEQLAAQVMDYDIVLTAISDAQLRMDQIDLRCKRPRTFIDLSVPRFFPAEVESDPSVDYHSLGFVDQLVSDQMEERKSSIPQAQGIIERYVHEFLEWSRIYEKSQVIQSWKQSVEEATSQCPFFHQQTEAERNHTIQKSVTQFVKFIKANGEQNAAAEELLQKYLDSL